MYDVIIIGGGPAGLSAAIYASRQGMKTLVISELPGGRISEAHHVENWLGFQGSGFDLSQKFLEHSKMYGAEFINNSVKDIKKKEKNFIVSTEEAKYESKTIILAMGMQHRKLNVPGEEELFGKGVSYCYTCDGPLFKGKIVADIGGADSACNGALFLSEYAEKVYLIYRKDKLRGEKITIDKICENPKIEVLYTTNVSEIKGDKQVESVILDNGKELKVDAVFIEIGHVPLTAIAKDLGIELNEKGFVKSDDHRKTNVDGVFVAGDICANNIIKQVVSGASDGAVAALSAFGYIKVGK